MLQLRENEIPLRKWSTGGTLQCLGDYLYIAHLKGNTAQETTQCSKFL